MPWMNVTCGSCRHTDDIALFTTETLNRYVCPGCGLVWRIEKGEPAQFFDNGFVIPATRKIVIESQMMLPRAA